MQSYTYLYIIYGQILLEQYIVTYVLATLVMSALWIPSEQILFPEQKGIISTCHSKILQVTILG